MGDYTLAPQLTLVVGMTGSGKSTFAFRYMLNDPATCNFIFDDLGRAATRLKIPPARTANELEAALSSRWVVFNPHSMFPGKVQEAFKFFCQWVYDASKRGPGKKRVLIDEVWQHMSPNYIPPEFSLCVQTGREENIELILATQLPHKIHSAITGQSTELVCFRLDEPLALERVKELGIDPREAQALPLGSFIASNRLSRGRLTGKLF